MKTQTCISCGLVFPSGFYANHCNSCLQTRAITQDIENQARASRQQQHNYYQDTPNRQKAPVIYATFDRSQCLPYVPPSPEYRKTQKHLRNINLFYKILLVLFPLLAWALLWVSTSGWVTFFSFVTVPFALKYLVTKHWYWQVKNAKYLFQS